MLQWLKRKLKICKAFWGQSQKRLADDRFVGPTSRNIILSQERKFVLTYNNHFRLSLCSLTRWRIEEIILETHVKMFPPGPSCLLRDKLCENLHSVLHFIFLFLHGDIAHFFRGLFTFVVCNVSCPCFSLIHYSLVSTLTAAIVKSNGPFLDVILFGLLEVLHWAPLLPS